MTPSRQLEIRCGACGTDAFIVREPRYEGLRKTGETLRCSACGHEYADEHEVPFSQKTTPKVFSQSDAARKISVFLECEKGRICRHCENYIVNPFTQRCGLSLKPVEATDSCDKFAVVETPEKEPADGGIPTVPPERTQLSDKAASDPRPVGSTLSA